MLSIVRNRSYAPGSLLSLNDYRELEAHAKSSSVNNEGDLLEYHHLELRVHPPNVEIDNSNDDRTIITLDSANRPGTLVELVECLTEMGLNVRRARISSDGGWFVDSFETDRITDQAKLKNLQRVLSADVGDDADTLHEETVFELAGNDKAGLLANVLQVLTANGCAVRSAAVWTHNQRCAFVISVLDQSSAPQPLAAGSGVASTADVTVAGGTVRGGTNPNGSGAGGARASRAGRMAQAQESAASKVSPVTQDPVKLAHLLEYLKAMMDSKQKGDTIVRAQVVRGAVHHERRLHQLLLREEEAAWERSPAVQEHYMRLVGKGDGNASSMSRAASTGSTHTMVSQGTLGSATVSAFTAATALSMPATVAGSSGPPASDLSGLGRRISTSRAPYHDDTAIGSSTSTSMPQTPTAGLGPTKGQNGSLLAANGPGQSRLALSNSLSTSCMSSATSTSSAVLVSSATANGSAAAPDVTAGLPPLPPHAPSSVVSDPWLVSPKACKPVVLLTHSRRLNYLVVDIKCKDRKKLLFDTVCTLSDLCYDIYHSSVDVDAGHAHQVFYVRPRYGECGWDPSASAKLLYMLETAILRRFPKGVKIRCTSWQQYDLAALAAAWRDAGLNITRCTVRPCLLVGPPGVGGSAVGARTYSSTYYLLHDSGTAPDPQAIQAACQRLGGVSLPAEVLSSSSSLPPPAGAPSAAPSQQQVAGAGAAKPRVGAPPGHAAGAAAAHSAASQGHTSASGHGTPASILELRDRYGKGGAPFGFTLLPRLWDGTAGTPGSSIASSQ